MLRLAPYFLHPCEHFLHYSEAVAVFNACAFKLPCHYFTPARDVLTLNWTDFTCDSERGYAEAFPKRFDTASRSLEELGLHT